MLLQDQWGVSGLTEAFERANKSQPRHEIVTNKDQRKLKACETTEEARQYMPSYILQRFSMLAIEGNTRHPCTHRLYDSRSRSPQTAVW